MLEQPPHAVREPTTCETIEPAGAAVLGGFPSHELLQMARVATVDREPQRPMLAHELSLLFPAPLDSLARFLAGDPVLPTVCQIDDRRRSR
jgi:hypothetical protein